MKPPLGHSAQCHPGCMCLCCQEARKPIPGCSDCGKDECECPALKACNVCGGVYPEGEHRHETLGELVERAKRMKEVGCE